MKKGGLLILLSVVFFGAALLFAATPTTVLIKSPVFKKLRKAPVPFNHKSHAAKIACKTCHHKYTGKGEPKKCDSCHTKKKQGKKLGLKLAFHKNCRGCHRKEKKEGKKTGPTRCNACHVKK